MTLKIYLLDPAAEKDSIRTQAVIENVLLVVNRRNRASSAAKTGKVVVEAAGK